MSYTWENWDNSQNSSNKKYILDFAETLSNDYFMYLDAEDMYKIIIKKFSTTKNNIAYNIKKYKIEFIKGTNTCLQKFRKCHSPIGGQFYKSTSPCNLPANDA